MFGIIVIDVGFIRVDVNKNITKVKCSDKSGKSKSIS